ncbi:hypothetical protein N2152v2_003950 [Parachlorella kessleri]
MAFQATSRAPQPPEGSPEENAVESSTFHMYFMKVTSCPNGRQPHDWNSCPYTHCGEKAVRRDPLTHQYSSTMCHEMKQVCCLLPLLLLVVLLLLLVGVVVLLAQRKPPTRYRTSLCRNGPFCQRKICFFAHSASQLRVPTTERPAIPPLLSPSMGPAASPMLPPTLGPSSPQRQLHQQQPVCPAVMLRQAGRLESRSSSGSGSSIGCGSREGLLSSSSGCSLSSGGVQLGHHGLLPDIPLYDPQLGSPVAASPALSLASGSSGGFTSVVPPALLLQSLAPGADVSARPPVNLATQGVDSSQAASILQAVVGQVRGGQLDVSTAAALLSTLIPGQLPLLQLALAAGV